VSEPNVVLNTAVAAALDQFATELEAAEDFNGALGALIRRVIKQHKRIIFNGNGYDDAWLEEAEKRGLSNLQTTPDALERFLDEKNVELFTSHKVYTEREMHSRYDILMESYCKLLHIEGRTMVDMARKDILPAVAKYSKDLCDTLLSKKAVCKKMDVSYEKETLENISKHTQGAFACTKDLEKALEDALKIKDVTRLANHYKNEVLKAMKALRLHADNLETLVGAQYWPFPTYGELLFSV
jgi:glutamine synthetase